MSDPARTLHQPEHSDLSLAELAALPEGAPELDRPLPAWVIDAHKRWLETGEGDPWGGYFK